MRAEWVRRAPTMRAIRVIAGTLVACLAAATPATAAAPSWWSYDRKPEYTTATSNVFIPVRDGTPIHCVLSRPAKDGTAAPDRFPALIEEFIPYAVVNAQTAAQGDDYWADHGYVALNCDVRGTGLSGGVWEGILSVHEKEDNYDVLQWMRQQPWSDGHLGQLGISYGGMTTMRVASLQPPGLDAILPIVSEDDLYRQDIYAGGIKSTPGSGDFWPAMTTVLSGGREVAAETYAQYLQHPLWDGFWQQISMWTKWSSIKVPVLSIGAWNDTLLPGGPLANWLGLQRAGNQRNYIIIGPWGHGQLGPPYALPQGAQLAWFDHWLMRLPSAPLPDVAVTSFQQPAGEAQYFPAGAAEVPAGDAGRGWQSYETWPPPGTTNVDWALNAGGKLARHATAAATASFRTLPTDVGDNGILDDGTPSPAQRADQTLVFDSDPLDADLAIAGRIAVNLRAALDQSDANLKAVAYDVNPSGAATFIAEGYLKASHRLSHEQATPVTPGTVTPFKLELFPADWRFAKGHRIRLRIYGGNSTELVPEPAPVTTTVSLGTGRSTVTLPEVRAIVKHPRRSRLASCLHNARKLKGRQRRARAIRRCRRRWRYDPAAAAR